MILKIRHIQYILMAFMMSFCVVSLSNCSVYAKSNPKYASLVMDADTGRVLHKSHADKQRHPASLTKAMTLLMAFEAIEEGRVNYNTRIKMSKHAASMVPSKLNLPVGSTIKMKDAIYALVTKSANDVAVAMAEHLAGSEYKFARQMNRKAREIGMTKTNFRNASGLHHPKQITTARDMAKMANYIIHRYPKYYKFYATQKFTYRGKTYKNHNRLMQTYKGMDGMKTGYISASGFNLVASAKRNNRRLIGVVFGGRTGASRNAHMAEILDAGFAKIKGTKAPPQSYTISHIIPPAPPRKPSTALAVNTMKRFSPAAGLVGRAAAPSVKPALNTSNAIKEQRKIVTPTAKNPASPQYKWASLNSQDARNYNDPAMFGQGDMDPDLSDEVLSGRMNIHDIQSRQVSDLNQNILKTAALERPKQNDLKNWAIQVGAFSSRASTDQMLHDARKTLPLQYADARPLIAPLKTNSGWLFRARLSGYTKAEAKKACSYLDNCLPIAPQNY